MAAPNAESKLPDSRLVQNGMPFNARAAHQKCAGENEKCDGKNLDHHQSALHGTAGAHTEAVNDGEN